MKTCTKCGIEKDESEYHKSKRTESGINTQCKICVGIRTKRYTSSEKFRETVKKRIPNAYKILPDNFCLDCKTPIKKYPTTTVRCKICSRLHHLNQLKNWHLENKEHEKKYEKSRVKERNEITKKYRQTDKSIITRLNKYVYPNIENNNLILESHLLIIKTKRLCKTSKI